MSAIMSTTGNWRFPAGLTPRRKRPTPAPPAGRAIDLAILQAPPPPRLTHRWLLALAAGLGLAGYGLAGLSPWAVPLALAGITLALVWAAVARRK